MFRSRQTSPPPHKLETKLMNLLWEYVDVLAWTPADLQGVDRAIIELKLTVNPNQKPQKQNVWKMSTERKEAARAEVRKLLKAKVIREITYPEWLANPVLVKKNNGKWRMCVDFTLQSKACPKDDFPLAHIDQIVDSTTGCERLCFLNAYSGYPHVWMAEEDQPRTSFITPDGTYCYLRMSFVL